MRWIPVVSGIFGYYLLKIEFTRLGTFGHTTVLAINFFDAINLKNELKIEFTRVLLVVYKGGLCIVLTLSLPRGFFLDSF